MWLTQLILQATTRPAEGTISGTATITVSIIVSKKDAVILNSKQGVGPFSSHRLHAPRAFLPANSRQAPEKMDFRQVYAEDPGGVVLGQSSRPCPTMGHQPLCESSQLCGMWWMCWHTRQRIGSRSQASVGFDAASVPSSARDPATLDLSLVVWLPRARLKRIIFVLETCLASCADRYLAGRIWFAGSFHVGLYDVKNG